MATPRADAYTAAAGGVIYGGRERPQWHDAVPLRQWYSVPGTNFKTLAAALMPYGNYPGSDPVAALVDAFGEPCFDPNEMAVYCHGGGHTDGLNNAVVKVDLTTLAHTLAIPPCDPAKWPPIYVATTTDRHGTLQYPSGATPEYYSSTLTDPRDTPYNQLIDTPMVTHQYGGMAIRQGRITYFYNQYKEADVRAARWSHIGGVDLGAQLNAINPNYKNGVLGQGTMALYDDVTDRHYVTLVPGDAGYNWRGGFIAFNPVTRQLDGNKIANVPTRSSMNFFKGGRYAYGLMHDVAAPNKGWRFNLDTWAVEYLVFTGDPMSYVDGSVPLMETLIANYHSGRGSIVRWGGNFDMDALYEVNVSGAPLGGNGSAGNPYQFAQVRIPIAGSRPAAPVTQINRMYFNPATGCILMLPRANSNWIAVKL
ncbi:hypothetical protein HNP55_003537 [Paucibacter oligotrophus]|uniref:Uncharacterized protein n=1 Tax=Roseateles oligotrophus TaxID=1769250 RepID=A0A840LB84_9BURK|nr:hypothetical protein [Roseateles oligotrophus]MBB4844991.1 hypothetical protein [Roseateles oligotrophus]